MIKPFTKILDPDITRILIQQTLPEELEFYDSLLNYSTNLVGAIFAKRNRRKDLSAYIVVGVLFKQVLRMFDGFRVLAAHGCFDAAKLQIRAMFEASAYIVWVLQKDTEKRAAYYYVANLREDLVWCKRLTPGTPERQAYLQSLGDNDRHTEESVFDLPEENIEVARNLESAIRDLLASDSFREVNQSFDSTKGRKNPSWYCPLGPNNLRELASNIDQLDRYQIIFVDASQTMHVSRMDDHINFSEQEVFFQPLRDVRTFSKVHMWAGRLALDSTRVVIEAYRPGQMKDFRRKFESLWKTPMQSRRKFIVTDSPQ